MITAMKFRQLFRPLLVIALLVWTSSFMSKVVVAEGPKGESGPSASTVHEPQGKATTTSSQSDAKAAIELATSLERQQQFDEAIRQYMKAVEISPQNVTAHNNLAWLLATCPVDKLRNGKEAITHATRACEITEWKHPSVIDTLSVALAEDGQFEKAIELLTKFRDGASASEREKIDRRLTLFRAGRTYRQAEAASPSPPAPQTGTKDKGDQELQTLCQEAAALERAGRRREAAVQYGKAVERAKTVLGTDHVVTAQLMVKQGDMYLYSEQFEAALPLFKDALPILRSHLPREHVAVTYCVNELGGAYNKTRQFEEALRLHLENLAVREAALGKDHPHVLTSLQNVASACMGLEDHEEAVRRLNDWLQRNERGQGDKHPELPVVLDMLGISYLNVNNPGQVEKCYTRALAILKAQANADRLQEARIPGDLGMLYADAGPGKFDDAKQYAECAVEITTSICGRDHIKTASAKGVLAIVYQHSRKFPEAEPLLRDAVRGMENALGKDSAEATRYRTELARVCLEAGRPEEAESICSHCVDVLEGQYGIQRYFLAIEESLSLLAEIAGRTGHQTEAEARLKRLIDTVENRLGKEHLLLAKLLMQVGEAYRHLGSNAAAKESYQRCLAIQRAKLGASHPDVGRTLQRLGLICLQTARYAEAEPFYEECLNIYRNSLGDEDRMVASGLCDLGFLYMRTNRFPEAEKTFQQAVAIAEKNPGFAADILAGILANWGRLCGNTGRFDMAESLHKRALTLAREIHGEQHPKVAWNCVYLAQAYWRVGRYSDAEPLYRQALAILESVEGKGHPDTHVPLTDLGGVLFDMGRYEEAESLLRQSLGLAKTGWSMNDRDPICTMVVLAKLQLKRGQSKEAVGCYMEVQRTHRHLLSHVLPGLSPAEQLVYLSSAQPGSLAQCLSLGLSHSDQTEAINAAAEWLLNGKALFGGTAGRADSFGQAKQRPGLGRNDRGTGRRSRTIGPSGSQSGSAVRWRRLRRGCQETFATGIRVVAAAWSANAFGNA